MTLADAPQRFSDAICARDYRCGGPLSLGFAFASAADCQTAYGAFYGDFFATIQEQVDEGAVEYVPEAVEDCLAYYDDCSPPESAAVPCMAMFLGQLEVGESCVEDLQCGAGTYCDLDRATCEGACRKQADEGEACGGSDPECGEGLYCDFDSDTCLSAKADGEVCTSGRECGYLVCANVQARATDMRCTSARDLLQANLAEGAACSEDSGFCAEGLFCVIPEGADVGACEKPFSRDGACVRTRPDACPADQFCDVDKGICTDRLTEGEPCDSPFSCGHGMVCDEDHCHRIFSRSVGESCQADAECTSVKCEAGTCVDILTCTPR